MIARAAPARLPPAVQLFLAGTVLVGAGQQLFVVVRNPHLAALGWTGPEIARVQGTGALAGVVAGLAGMVLVGRVAPAVLLVASALLQGGGFAVQALAGGPGWMIAGAAVSGLGIQLQTALAAPFVRAAATPERRVGVLATQNALLWPVGSLAAAALVAGVAALAGEGEPGRRLALLAGAAVSTCAALPWLGARVSPETPLEPRPRPRFFLRRPAVLLGCAVPEALLAVAAGLAVPYLPLLFATRFGFAPTEVASLHAVSMGAGVLGFVAAPAIARRTGLWQATVAGVALAVPLIALLAWTGRLELAIPLLLARQLVANLVVPVANSLYQEVAAEGDGPALAAALVLVRSAAWTVGTFLAGPLLGAGGDRFDRALGSASAVLAVAAVVAGLILPRLWTGRGAVPLDGSPAQR